jgi:putative acetyltransferase
MLTPVDVQYNPFSLVTMGLGPIAVTPEFQRFGIGSRLIRVGINRCRIVGCQVIFVLGHSDYYPKFGFKPSSEIGCFYKSHDFDSHFFYLEVTPGAVSDLSGEVRYLPPFDDA